MHEIVDAAVLGTPRAREAAEAFGIHAGNTTRRLLDHVEVPTSGITLVVGQSGSGKSTLLRLLAERFPEARSLAPSVPDDGAVIDGFPGDISGAIHWLGKFGLGEARLLLTRPSLLSEGQKHRLLLARLLWDRPATVLVDEFGSMLDRVTAKVIAHNLQKVCRERGVTAYLVTAHDDLVEPLQPDAVVRLDLDGSSTTTTRPTGAVVPFDETPLAAQLETRAGTLEDYRCLAPFHYREEEEGPDAWTDLLREVRVVTFGGRVVGVKLFTRPFARALEALPLFRELNERVLVQERTIVHPVFRGIALNRFMTPVATAAAEVVFAQSALGIHFPYNLKAGFTRVAHPAESPDRFQLALRERVLELAGGTELNPHSTAQLTSFVERLSAGEVDSLSAIARPAFASVNLRFVRLLAGLVGRELRATEEQQVKRLFELTFDRSAPLSLPRLVETAMPFPMAAFVRALA